MGMARQSTGTATPVLLTRPEAQSRSFATAMEARLGALVRPVIAPLMAPVFLPPDLPEGPFAAVIFTSATAITAVAGLDLPKRAWCVGAQTAARASAAGFQAVSAEGDAAALVAAVLADPPDGRLLHMRGEEVRGDVAERLNSAGIETVSAIVYRQEPLALTPEAAKLLGANGGVIVPLFSPRSAVLLRQALPAGVRATLWLVAMSDAVAEAAEGLPQEALVIARRPDADAMLEAVERFAEMRRVP
jgi:uroporphyrinogen-III synthase